MKFNFWGRVGEENRIAFFGLFVTLSVMAVPADAQTKVMSLGDSLCHNNMQALRSKISQSGLKVDWVGTMKDGPAPDPDNECHGGWQAAQVIGDKAPPPWIKAGAPVLNTWVAVAKPQIALVMLGTNDIISGGKDTLVSNLRRIIDTLHKGSPRVHIVLASIPPITYEPAGGMVREINKLLPSLVRAKQAEGKKISFLNMYSKIPVSAIVGDKVHLSEAGNQAMANAWLSALNPLVRSKKYVSTATPLPVRKPTASSGQNRGTAINSVATILSDMQGSHESRLSGVPDSYDWAKGPRLGMGNNPGRFRALTAWGQIYREAGAAVPANTRIEIRNMKAYILHKSDNKWHKVQDSKGVEGGAYVEDFAGDKSIAPDIRKEPSGSVSVKLTPGHNYHFWPTGGRANFDPKDLVGVYVTYQARLILNNPSATDDRHLARFLAGAGGDYWLNATAQSNNFQANGDFAIAKMKLVTKNWRAFNAITVGADQLRSAPPPIE